MVVAVDEVEKLLVEELGACAQLGAQVFEGLVAVGEGGEVLWGREVRREECRARKRSSKREGVEVVIVVATVAV